MDLYEIITERSEHGSLIITSNRAFEEWGEIFANDLLASAALDREPLPEAHPAQPALSHAFARSGEEFFGRDS